MTPIVPQTETAEIPVIQINLDSETPVYRQIEDAIRALLVERKLKPGDKMPTVRQLAFDLTVHHNTVAEAYRHLAAEGWLDLKRRRGALVTKRQGPRSTARAKENFLQRVRELAAKARASGLNRKEIQSILRTVCAQKEETSS